MSSLDGESAWRDLNNGLDDQSKADYFRLNITVRQKPSIDDTTCFERLREMVRFQF